MRTDPIERLLRGLYAVALYLLVPVTVYHLIWRGFRQSTYFQRWNERYAIYGDAPQASTLWVHAVSVGEVNAAVPLVNALRREYPRHHLLVTTITPTGSARVRAIWGDKVEHVYLPYDLPGAVSRFLRHYQPSLALILETELWPNLLFGCRDHGIPVYVVNARLSGRSLRGYRVLRPLVSRALRTLRGVLAQSAADGKRFVCLGAARADTHVTGNLKYDITVGEGWPAFAAAFGQRIGGGGGGGGAAASALAGVLSGSQPVRMPRRRQRSSRSIGVCASVGQTCCCCGHHAIRSVSSRWRSRRSMPVGGSPRAS